MEPRKVRQELQNKGGSPVESVTSISISADFDLEGQIQSLVAVFLPLATNLRAGLIYEHRQIFRLSDHYLTWRQGSPSFGECVKGLLYQNR